MNAAAGWRSEQLGDDLRLELAQGPIGCFRRGAGPPLVFCHGWLANANLWRDVVERLAGRFTCICLDLPLGSHRLAMGAEADLTPEGCGELITSALEVLELREVTLIGNDSGGAYSQIALAGHPERVGRLVLNSCETPYDEFPPPPFDGLPAAARDAETLRSLLSALRDRDVRRLPGAYGLLIKHPIEDHVSDAYALPCLEDDGIMRDLAKVMASASSPPVHAAGGRLIESFHGPVLFAWSREDQVFPPAHAERYAAALRDGRVELLDDAYSFTGEDQPGPLAAAIAGFAGTR
jgi:pimeloyl-ACP methyl ester carboxylesterase